MPAGPDWAIAAPMTIGSPLAAAAEAAAEPSGAADDSDELELPPHAARSIAVVAMTPADAIRRRFTEPPQKGQMRTMAQGEPRVVLIAAADHT
jgi:hypothetical protein